MSGRGEGFLSRWSRLKRADAIQGEGPKADGSAESAEPAPAPPAETGAAVREEETAREPELPAIDSLTAESDYKPFLRADVPEELRRQALRRLWVSDPVLSRPEVLDLHCEDYNRPSLVAVGKTLYRVGAGMMDALDRKAGKAPEAEPPEGADAPHSEPAQASDGGEGERSA